ncbi:MAG: hypothetical protein HOQ24_02385 [Mycobacteriaceae bacterium]|nr:hypothetical protein [Mycobacteriaceae bacterium]
MASGTFSFQNTSGYTDRIDNPDEYRTYNIGIRPGSIENRTTATAWLYSRPDGGGDSEYVNPNSSTYATKGYQSFKFTS